MVSSTASGDTGEVGNADAPGTAVGGANSANPTGRSSTVTIWPADPQVSITPESQTSFSNSVSPSRPRTRTASASSSQATQPRQRSGSKPMVVIDNGTSARVTPLPVACADPRGRSAPARSGAAARPSRGPRCRHQNRSCPDRRVARSRSGPAAAITEPGAPGHAGYDDPDRSGAALDHDPARRPEGKRRRLEVAHDGQQPGPAHAAIRATYRGHASLGHPGTVRRRQPSRGGVAGRRHAVPEVAAAGVAGRRGRRAGRRGRPGRPAVRVRPGHPAAARADLSGDGARGHQGAPGRRDGHRRLADGAGPDHPDLHRSG